MTRKPTRHGSAGQIAIADNDIKRLSEILGVSLDFVLSRNPNMTIVDGPTTDLAEATERSKHITQLEKRFGPLERISSELLEKDLEKRTTIKTSNPAIVYSEPTGADLIRKAAQMYAADLALSKRPSPLKVRRNLEKGEAVAAKAYQKLGELFGDGSRDEVAVSYSSFLPDDLLCHMAQIRRSMHEGLKKHTEETVPYRSSGPDGSAVHTLLINLSCIVDSLAPDDRVVPGVSNPRRQEFLLEAIKTITGETRSKHWLEKAYRRIRQS
jgi:hypothetical protein